MALCCGAGMAATVAIDLNGEAAEGASLPANLKLSGFGDVNSGNVITAQKVVTWLQGTTGWQGTTANGNSGSGIYGSVTASGDTDVSVSFINRNAYGGSIVGTAVTLTSDYASYTGLTLSVDCAGLQSGANFTTLNIVYQTAEGWQISQLTGQAVSIHALLAECDATDFIHYYSTEQIILCANLPKKTVIARLHFLSIYLSIFYSQCITPIADLPGNSCELEVGAQAMFHSL